MDASVLKAMEKWPNVPALHGWLSLDEAGRWRLKEEPITHPGLIAFINRNYECDTLGRWFFQNGPQRGYVRLDYTPWVAHVDSGGQLRLHTGRAVSSMQAAHVDEEGNLLLATDAGPALVEAGSLPAIAEGLRDDSGESADPDRLMALSEEAETGLRLAFGGFDVPVSFVPRAEVPARYGYVQDPAAVEA